MTAKSKRDIMRGTIGVYICLGTVFMLPFLGFSQTTTIVDEVRDLRLWGSLAQAQALAEAGLAKSPFDVSVTVRLHLELARIHDRTGLHYNNRPVAAAMAHVDSAASLPGLSPGLVASIDLERATLVYMAGRISRDFRSAEVQAHSAARVFRSLGDRHGEAEAIHLVGLIHLQRGELVEARKYFDHSLELDKEGGSRLFFGGEYGRHIGMVELMEGDSVSAVEHFERSLSLRRQMGARDASLFAATTLSATLIGLGRIDDARTHLLYGMTVAAGLDSPFGRAQLSNIAGMFYLRTGERDAAQASFETALAIAESIKAGGIAQQARNRIVELRGRY